MEPQRGDWEPVRETNRRDHGDATARQPLPATQRGVATRALKLVHPRGTSFPYSRGRSPPRSADHVLYPRQSRIILMAVREQRFFFIIIAFRNKTIDRLQVSLLS